MKTTRTLAIALAVSASLAACDTKTAPADSTAPAAQTPQPAAQSSPAEENPFAETATPTILTPVTLPPFSIRAEHLGPLTRGHFNLYVEGGEPAAVRAWIGDEAATSVVVTRAEFEGDHHCAHMEVADPLPDGARLWVEIETASGERLKGSTALQ